MQRRRYQVRNTTMRERIDRLAGMTAMVLGVAVLGLLAVASMWALMNVALPNLVTRAEASSEGWIYVDECVCDGSCRLGMDGVIPSEVDPCGGGAFWEVQAPWKSQLSFFGINQTEWTAAGKWADMVQSLLGEGYSSGVFQRQMPAEVENEPSS